MKSRRGYLQGYNGQVAVSEEQLIMAASLTQEANDQHQLSPMLETLQENLQAIDLQSIQAYWKDPRLSSAMPVTALKRT